MNHSERIISLSLLCALLASCAACGESDDTDDTTAQTTAEVTTAADPNGLSLPPKTFDGKTLRIGHHISGNCRDILTIDEDTGDVVDSAIFRRNQQLEEKYEIKLDFINSNVYAGDFQAQVYNLIMAGDDVYDLCIGNNQYWCQYIPDLPYMNYHDLEYLDYDKPWWNKTSVEDQTFNGKMYLYQPMITEETVSNTQFIVMNLKLLEDNGLEMPYELVRDGKWTVDELIKMTKDIYLDTNGNSQRDLADTYGFSCYSQREGWGNAFDLEIIGKEGEDYTIAINEEYAASIVEKLYSFYFEQSGTLVTTDYTIDGVVQVPWHCQKFANGTSMSTIMEYKNVEQYLRYSNIDYGIVPYPKWDENQENYRSIGGGQGVIIPITVQDPDFVGYMLEAMCYETYNEIIPAYYEIALKEKFVQNEDDKDMVEIISSTAMAWVPYTYRDFTGLGGIIDTLMLKRSDDFASWYAGLKTQADTLIKKFNDIMSK